MYVLKQLIFEYAPFRDYTMTGISNKENEL